VALVHLFYRDFVDVTFYITGLFKFGFKERREKIRKKKKKKVSEYKFDSRSYHFFF
jgi:hypothetical protein